MEDNLSPDGYRPMIQISLNKNGEKKLDIAPVAKEVIINLMTDALRIIAMKPDNVRKPPPGLSPAGVAQWFNRQKNKAQNKK